ncbi:GreA/GreB family elongation factor [Pseudomonas sp. Marseille-QA0892]
MDKAALVRCIIEQLENDRRVTADALKAAHEAATHEESKAENKYDTRGLEAAYLADGQRKRLHELEAAVMAYRNLVLEPMEERIRLGALVSLGADSGRKDLFLGPNAAGLKVRQAAREILVITPLSPLGKALLGAGEGDEVDIVVGGRRQRYEVIEIE